MTASLLIPISSIWSTNRNGKYSIRRGPFDRFPPSQWFNTTIHTPLLKELHETDLSCPGRDTRTTPLLFWLPNFTLGCVFCLKRLQWREKREPSTRSNQTPKIYIKFVTFNAGGDVFCFRTPSCHLICHNFSKKRFPIIWLHVELNGKKRYTSWPFSHSSLHNILSVNHWWSWSSTPNVNLDVHFSRCASCGTFESIVRNSGCSHGRWINTIRRVVFTPRTRACEARRSSCLTSLAFSSR